VRRRRPWIPKAGDRVVVFKRHHGRVSTVDAFDVVVDLDEAAPTGNGDHSRIIAVRLDQVEAEGE
jgi:hypothetical protein